MTSLPTIEGATRTFLENANRYGSGVRWESHPEWVDGSRVLEFHSKVIEAREGWFVLAKFGNGGCTRCGPVGGLATAEAIVADLRRQQAAVVGAALGAFHAEIDAFDYPDWPSIQPTSTCTKSDT